MQPARNQFNYGPNYAIWREERSETEKHAGKKTESSIDCHAHCSFGFPIFVYVINQLIFRKRDINYNGKPLSS